MTEEKISEIVRKHNLMFDSGDPFSSLMKRGLDAAIREAVALARKEAIEECAEVVQDEPLGYETERDYVLLEAFVMRAYASIRALAEAK